MKHGVYDILFRSNLSYCTKCRRVLPVYDFYQDRRKKNGLSYHCKACRDGYKAGTTLPTTERRHKGKGRWWKQISDVQDILTASGLAYCSRCERILLCSEFYRENFRGNGRCNRHGLMSHCKGCHDAYAEAKRPPLAPGEKRKRGWPKGKPRKPKGETEKNERAEVCGQL
jgi:RNase P subunit RPR2